MDIFDLRNEKYAASPAELDQHQGQFLSFCKKKKKIIFTSSFGMLSPCYCYWKDFKFWWSAQGDIWDSAIKTRIMRAYLKNNIWQVRDPGASIRWLPVGVLVSRRMCFTMKANCQSRVSEVVYFH